MPVQLSSVIIGAVQNEMFDFNSMIIEIGPLFSQSCSLIFYVWLVSYRSGLYLFLLAFDL